MKVNNKEEKKNIKNISDYIASSFGFNFLDIKTTVFFGKEENVLSEEKIKVIKNYAKKDGSKKIMPSRMLFYNKPLLKKSGSLKKDKIGLDIINFEGALAEAVVIKTAISILEEEGYKNIEVALNSIGDKESVKIFKKELAAYYRKNKLALKKNEIAKITKDPMELLLSKLPHLVELNHDAPKPINFLLEEDIKFFQQVIEFLENLNINYSINDSLFGDKEIFSKTIFQITGNLDKKEKENLAFGGRYDDLAKSTARKRKISAVGLSMDFTKKNKKALKLSEKKVNIHLLKIGYTANLKFLEVLDVFKKVGQPLKYDIVEEKISNQIVNALEDKADYSIIFGQKEANENKVVLREMKTKSQNEIEIKNLQKYIKKLI